MACPRPHSLKVGTASFLVQFLNVATSYCLDVKEDLLNEHAECTDGLTDVSFLNGVFGG